MKGIFNDLYNVILERKNGAESGSYTKYLLDNGTDKILKKFGEEAIEVIIASKGNYKEQQIAEIGDMIYHLLVLMVDRGIEVDAVESELISRREKVNNFKGDRAEIKKL